MGRLAIFQKKERWTPTGLGYLLIFMAFILVIILYVMQISSFLSTSRPIRADILVVEGYLPDYALEEAMHIFQQGGYSHMIIAGKPRQKGAHLDQYSNDGDFSAATMLAMGFDSTNLSVAVTDSSLTRDRTYASGQAVSDWMKEYFPGSDAIDLVSLGCHSRRSRRLFQKALGDNAEVGIYAITDRSYDPKRWWRSSHGFREINKETIAWIYARFFFHPTND